MIPIRSQQSKNFFPMKTNLGSDKWRLVCRIIGLNLVLRIHW